jgi:hypothetical protein
MNDKDFNFERLFKDAEEYTEKGKDQEFIFPPKSPFLIEMVKKMLLNRN